MKNPNVEVLTVHGDEFMRYDGTVKIVKDAVLLDKVRAAMPQIMALFISMSFSGECPKCPMRLCLYS